MIPDIEATRQKTLESKAGILRAELEELRGLVAYKMADASERGQFCAIVHNIDHDGVPIFYNDSLDLIAAELSELGYKVTRPKYTETLIISWSPASPESSTE